MKNLKTVLSVLEVYGDKDVYIEVNNKRKSLKGVSFDGDSLLLLDSPFNHNVEFVEQCNTSYEMIDIYASESFESIKFVDKLNSIDLKYVYVLHDDIIFSDKQMNSYLEEIEL